MTRKYLDYNATAPLHPRAREAMLPWLGVPANASSPHTEGRAARQAVEEARARLAEWVSVFPAEVFFCASGTEANRWVLQGFSDRRVLASAVEHASARAEIEFPVDANGVARLDVLEEMLRGGGEALVTLMLANNETGVIQPVAEAAALCRKYGALLHCDASQALGKIPVDCNLLGADFYTFSAHKCGGPLGAAVLVVRGKNAPRPLLLGGGQEKRQRAGTENVAAIAGFGACVGLDVVFTQPWMRALEREAKARGAVIFGEGAARLPNTSCFAMPGKASEIQLMRLDLQGFAVSAGSACASGRVEPSHVLLAMDAAPELAGCAIRVSAGWGTVEEDVVALSKVL